MKLPNLSALQTILIASLALSIGGCAVGPDYQTPDVTAPADWTSEHPDSLSAKGQVDQNWWKNFKDPALTRLIEQASANNFDLKIAEARIAQSRAAVDLRENALLPTVNIKGTATREANQTALPGGNASGFASLLKKPYNLFQTGFDASWELDLFGGNRRSEEAAEATLQSSEASRDDVRVSLLAEVARTYVSLRQYQAQFTTASDVLNANKKTAEIEKELFDVGQSPQLDLTQAEAQIEQAQTQLPNLRNQIAQAEYNLDVLLGAQPGTAHAIVSKPAPIPSSDTKLVLNAPAVIIDQRPDIHSAERKLAAATAQQGVATAKFYPDISLSAFFGALNTSANNLITASNKSWMAGASVVWPILNYGALSANLDNANAAQQEAFATYQKTVIGALSDVEQSLTSYTEQEKFVKSAAQDVEKNKHARDIAQSRFQEGLTSRLDVLTADRALYAAEDRLTQARAEESRNLIAVYKSLGGGWTKS